MQRAEMEELRHREANNTALQAIGPRKKPRLDSDAATTVVSLITFQVWSWFSYLWKCFIRRLEQVDQVQLVRKHHQHHGHALNVLICVT